MIQIFEYTDYRKYLADWYTGMKAEDSHFSYRYIGTSAGIDAGNLAKVIKGQRNLSIPAALKLAAFMKLARKEKEYFQNMILFCDARNHKDRKRYFEAMMTFKESNVRILDAAQYEFYNKWYYTAVREALAFFPFNGENCSELGKIIIPSISADEVKKAIDLLQKLDLIEQNKKGFYKRKDALISTGNDVQSLALNNFIINTMKLAEQSITRSPGEINLSSVSLTLSENDFKEVQSEVRAFRRRIMEMAKKSMKPQRVYQFNMQLFPLTKSMKRTGK